MARLLFALLMVMSTLPVDAAADEHGDRYCGGVRPAATCALEDGDDFVQRLAVKAIPFDEGPNCLPIDGHEACS